MARRRGYHHLEDGEWFELNMRAHWDQCCSCALIHKQQYVALDKKTGKRARGIKILMRAYRDDRATAAARRNFKFEKDDE